MICFSGFWAAREQHQFTTRKKQLPGAPKEDAQLRFFEIRDYHKSLKVTPYYYANSIKINKTN